MTKIELDNLTETTPDLVPAVVPADVSCLTPETDSALLKKNGSVRTQAGKRPSTPDATLSETGSQKWERKFAEHVKRDQERLAAARASLPKPKFNHAAWRHRP
jgi:hypothetical protein